jgi:hypothetical protein
VGDIIAINEELAQGWVKVGCFYTYCLIFHKGTLNGKVGLVPKAYVESISTSNDAPPKKKAVALYDFEGPNQPHCSILTFNSKKRRPVGF